MRYLYIYISLILFSQNSYADVVLGAGITGPCSYRGTVIDLDRTDSGIKLLINVKENYPGKLKGNCQTSLNENITLVAPADKEIKIGDDIKFSATLTLITYGKDGEKVVVKELRSQFNHWE